MNHERQGTHGFWVSTGLALAAVSCGASAPGDDMAASGAMTGTTPLTSSSSGSASVAGSSSAGRASTGAAGGIAVASAGAAGMLATPATAQAGSSGAPLASQAGAGAGGSAGAGAAAAGASGNEGAAGMTNAAAGAGGASGSGSSVDPTTLPKFSFFVTSFAGMQRLSGSEKGFGGDLRYGQADGLTGADKICSDLAEVSMEGASAKGWRAFLSVAEGPDGEPVNAIDRIGEGPWYDRLGRVLAMNKSALLNTRPQGADPAIVDDFPNEEGVPNQTPDPSMGPVNNHHVLTGSDDAGKLYRNAVTSTCNNWTTTDAGAGRPRIGFSYPAGNRQHWISGQDEGGCGAGAVLVDQGGSDPSNPIVGSGGGYGGIYCFALMP